MEPRIQYVQTKDGVNIAFWTLGEGPPFVQMPAGETSHIQLEWQVPPMRRWYEHVARRRMVVRYDGRGTGLSDRDVADYSLNAVLMDLEAVVDRLGLKTFSLLGCFDFGAVAIAHAVRCPEQVSHLLLWCASVRGADAPPASDALREVGDRDWGLYAGALAGLVGATREEIDATSTWLRESVTQEAARAMNDIWRREFDVMSLLPNVTSPTLVLHRRGLQVVGADAAKRLASRIPDARLALLEGSSPFLFVEHAGSAIRAIDEFLGDGEEPEREVGLPQRTAVILFLDIADSVALTERLGDAPFRAKAGELDASLRETIREAGGTPVEGKVLGDGVMAMFSSARQAIDCALRCRVVGEERGLPLHLGIHAGDVLREGNTVYGGAVNLAQRITDASAPGQILVSDIVRGLARTSADVAFEDRGEHGLKGIPEPQRLYAVREPAGGG